MKPQEPYNSNERFTPDEAVEILKRAAALEKERFSVEDLCTMAQEAGVSREAVMQAIAEHRSQQQQIAQEQERHAREYALQQQQERNFWMQLYQIAMLLLVFLGIFALSVMCLFPPSYQNKPAQPPRWAEQRTELERRILQLHIEQHNPIQREPLGR